MPGPPVRKSTMTEHVNDSSPHQSTYGLAAIIGLCIAIVVTFDMVAAIHGAITGSGRSWYDPPIALFLVTGVALSVRPGLITRSRWRPRLVDVAVGAPVGCLIVAVEFVIKRNPSDFLSPLPEGVFVPVVVLGPLVEEAFFRSVVLMSLKERMPLWLAIAMVALLAALGHANFWVALPAQVALSVLYCAMGNSVAASSAAHMTINLVGFLLIRAPFG